MITGDVCRAGVYSCLLFRSLFGKKDVYKYRWVRMVEGRESDRALMDYMSLPKRMLGRLLPVNVCR